jgi:hypothetical protein
VIRYDRDEAMWTLQRGKMTLFADDWQGAVDLLQCYVRRRQELKGEKMVDYYLQTDTSEPVKIQAAQIRPGKSGRTDFLDDSGDVVAHAVHSPNLAIQPDVPLTVAAFYTTRGN